MSGEVVKVDWEGNLARRLAAISDIPMWKIIRNAARDFARSALVPAGLEQRAPRRACKPPRAEAVPAAKPPAKRSRAGAVIPDTFTQTLPPCTNGRGAAAAKRDPSP